MPATDKPPERVVPYRISDQCAQQLYHCITFLSPRLGLAAEAKARKTFGTQSVIGCYDLRLVTNRPTLAGSCDSPFKVRLIPASEVKVGLAVPPIL